MFSIVGIQECGEVQTADLGLVLVWVANISDVHS